MHETVTRILFIAGWLLSATVCLGESPDLTAGMRAYQAGDFGEARRISALHLDQPHGRLVHALCLVHDADRGDLDQGLAALQALYRDTGAPVEIRLEAGLAYGRMIQLLQVRSLHPQFAGVDTAAFFREYIRQAGHTEYACLAALNLVELYCDNGLLQKDPRQADQALSFLETFFSDYQGPASDLLPLHLLAEGLYEEVTADFEKCYHHLSSAYRLGITKMQIERTVLFKMGRINHIKLNDPDRAAGYYRVFLKKYPNAQRTPQVKRYLAELPQEDS